MTPSRALRICSAPGACVNCGNPVTTGERVRWGDWTRCNPCSQYFRRHGEERPRRWIEARSQREEGKKFCRRCQVFKPLGEFHKIGGKRFPNTKQVDCKACARQRQSATRARADWTPKATECAQCGNVFQAHPHRANATYCSSRCHERAWKTKNPERRNAINAKRRALKRGAKTALVVDRLVIYERDGWRCKLCGKAVRKNLSFRHPMSATLDHIVPLSKGGSHAPANLQLAHRRCNSKKYNLSHGEQLMLIG